MSRKHYRAIAQAMALAAASVTPPDRADLTPEQERLFKSIADELARVMQRDNGRFNRQRFLSACGL